MNLSVLSALIFIAVFAVVVFIHEFGHFIVARLLKWMSKSSGSDCASHVDLVSL